MSLEVSKNSTCIDIVDVDEEVKENGTKSELSCDSGIETFDSNSTNYPSSSESDLSPTKYTKNISECNEVIVPETPNTLEIRAPDLISNFKIEKTLNFNPDTNKIENIKDIVISANTDHNIGAYNTDALEAVDGKTNSLISNNALATSTLSLNEQILQENKINTKYSKSAENLLVIEENVIKNSSTSELDKDEILSQFKNKKNIVSATQKITQDNTQYDNRYGRLPKEILAPDLGSIVKNVHGIFSSVSGSLKNAYNNSHKVSIQKPQMKYAKPMPSEKIMNDIFEDVPDKISIESNIEQNSHNAYINEDIPNLSHEVIIENGDTTGDMHKLQVESLERVLLEQRKENMSLREKVKQQVDELQAKDQMFKELEAKVDLMCKRADQIQKEKDAAVMRYASTECAAIEAKRAAESAAKSERAAIAERDLLTAKLKTAREEKQRICQLYDDKCHELQNCDREMCKVREELREVEGRLKWTQSKLRMEMDAYKESSERTEKLSQQVAELEAARETAVVNATDSVRAKQLETDLKENQAALIMCRHEREDLERRLTAALQQLDSCRKERDDAIETLTRTNAQVEDLQQSNLRLEEEAAELAALRARAALADTLASQLQRETERAIQAEEALSQERARAETCARREAAALEHSASLTAQHVAARARAADHRAQAQALAADNSSLRERLSVLEDDNRRLQTALDLETERRNKENRVLAMKVAELTEELEKTNKVLEWEKGENGVLKKKHASAVKEMNRELQRALKRIELLEAKLPQPDADSTRTGSVSSLSSGESPGDERASDSVPTVQAREPDRQALIERIVSLQRAAARRAERCEFLEEHARALTAELRGKSRLLRRLLPALPPAQLANIAADGAKQEIARLGGGAMAAVWGGDPEGLTPELSLEMNKRLQALLEDTLLKNITLKENIDTLGEEIARLKQQKNDSN